MTIERWDPFGEMLSLREAMNRLFEESFIGPNMATRTTTGGQTLPVDLRETEDNYILEAPMPGVKPEDVDVTVQGNQLFIQGESSTRRRRKGSAITCVSGATGASSVCWPSRRTSRPIRLTPSLSMGF